ncbi:hypothetical protein G3I32_17620 [Streptomyces coelicoflavus]|uniref:Hydrolase n=2 Tax=Streptomyces coelicoflavus TaxID=285562 RepID=A0A7K3PL37_9ACTN|nr:hypothetical protein [Streptomyces coelicoflavus]
MRRIPAAFATLALAVLGALVPATGAQASTASTASTAATASEACENAWHYARGGYLYLYNGIDCSDYLASTAAGDRDWGDSSGSVHGVAVGTVKSLLFKASSALAVELYAGTDHTGSHVCLTRSEPYLTELGGAEFPDGTPLDAARSHRWTWASACDDRFLG